MQTSRELIRKLGGLEAVASALGEDWKTVANWSRTGRRIPAKEWHRIAALPNARGMGITIDVLASMPSNPAPTQDAAA